MCSLGVVGLLTLQLVSLRTSIPRTLHASDMAFANLPLEFIELHFHHIL